MKALTSSETPKHKLGRRMSKPLMERRRRERINHSLETLRLLMLENRHSEKLKNPKVEKAEILESVVEFLKAEKEMGKGQEAPKRALSSGHTPACTRQSSYQDGVRSCLLKVGRFIATKSHELEEPACGTAPRASFAHPEPRARPASPGRVRQPPVPTPAPHAPPAVALSPQHELRRQADLHGDTGMLLSSSAAAVSAHVNDPVWRPWPQ